MLCKEFGATILMVTHDALSDSYYDRILFMQDGEIKAFLDREHKTKQVFFTHILEIIVRLLEMIVMYLKLAIHNAGRFVYNYLTYITSMTIFLAIMFVSNCIAIIEKGSASFQTISLPLLIALILAILSGYINSFMLKRRAKEFANYILLGFSRIKVLWMLFIEFFVIGFYAL